MSIFIILYSFSICIYILHIYVPSSFLSARWNRSRRHRSEAIASSTSHDRRGQPLAENGQFKSVEVFFLTCKVVWFEDVWNVIRFGLVIFFSLWEVGIDWDTLEFLRNGSTKILETSLSSESDSTGCHDVPCHRTSVIFPNKTSNIHVCFRRVVTGLTCGSGDMLAQGKRFCSGVFWKTHVTWLGWRLYCIWKEWCKKPHQWD